MRQLPLLNELNLLRFSVFLELSFGITGILVATYSGSQAVFLDGSYSLLCTLTMMVNVRVSRVVKLPPSPNSPYGFPTLEPLMLIFQGVILLGLCITLLSFSIYELCMGGYTPEFDLALSYEIFSTIVGGATAIIFLMLYRSNPSPLIYFEFQEWLVDASVSASATIAFTVAYLLGNSHPVTPYIDSALTLLLLLFLIRLPLKTLHKNYKQLLLQDLAEPGLVQRVKETISEQHRAITNQHINISMIWLGRWLWVNIKITVDNDLLPTTGEMKAIRTTVATAIRSESRYHRIQLSLDFPEN